MLAVILLTGLAMLGLLGLLGLGAMTLMLGLRLMLPVIRRRLGAFVALVALCGLRHGRRDECECRCGGKKNDLHVIIS